MAFEVSSDGQNSETNTSASTNNNDFNTGNSDLDSALQQKYGSRDGFLSFMNEGNAIDNYKAFTDWLNDWSYNHNMDSDKINMSAINKLADAYGKDYGNVFNRKQVKREFINNFLQDWNSRHAQQLQKEDLERAGLNPLLMYQGGVSSGAQVTSRKTTEGASEGFMKLLMMLLMMGKVGVSAASIGKD